VAQNLSVSAIPTQTLVPAPRAVHYGWLALGTLILTIYGSLIPFQFEPQSLDDAIAGFREMTYYQPGLLEARGDWIVSMVLFLVLSYLAMAALCVDRPWEFGIGIAVLVVPACVLLSVLIEFAQVFFPPRTVSVNDIWVESLGGLAGAGAWLAGGQRMTHWLRRLGTIRRIDWLTSQAAPAYLVLVFVLQLMPFDFILGPSELVLKFREGKVSALGFGGAELEATALMSKLVTLAACFLPLGFLRALAPTQLRGRAGWVGALLFGVAVTVTAKFLQLLVYSRSTDLVDIPLGTLLVLAGWRLGVAWNAGWRSTRARPAGDRVTARGGWRAAFLVWLGLVHLGSWWPFDFTTDPTRFASDQEELPALGLRRISLAPFVDYYWGSKYEALQQFALKGLMFAPLGALMAFRPWAAPRSGLREVVTVGVVVATLVQLGRYFIPERTPSVTDALLQSGAACGGFLVGRHIRTCLRAETALQGTPS
jgi:VanZ family protein